MLSARRLTVTVSLLVSTHICCYKVDQALYPECCSWYEGGKKVVSNSENLHGSHYISLAFAAVTFNRDVI